MTAEAARATVVLTAGAAGLAAAAASAAWGGSSHLCSCGSGSGRRSSPPPPPWLSVTTFGAPKVGNAAWVSLMDSLVPEHWRCVVANDVITTVPPFKRYVHAGTSVLLDLSGDLFIDPLAATKRTLHGGAVSIRFHGRFAYMLALSAVGVSHFHGSTTRRRLFWRWPLPPLTKQLLGPPPPPPPTARLLTCLTCDADLRPDVPVLSLARGAAGAAGAALAAAEAATTAAVRDAAGRRRWVWGVWARWGGGRAARGGARRAIPTPVLGRWARLVQAARLSQRAAEVAAHPRRARRLRPLAPLRSVEAYAAAVEAVVAAADQGRNPGEGESPTSV